MDYLCFIKDKKCLGLCGLKLLACRFKPEDDNSIEVEIEILR